MNRDRQYNDNKETDMRAMRLMEALSGVDEELLERSDCPVNNSMKKAVWKQNGFHSGKVMPLWRYAGTWAAVLCLAAVGAVSWGGYQLIQDSDTSGSGGASSIVMESLLEEGGQEAATAEDNAYDTAGISDLGNQKDGGYMDKMENGMNGADAGGREGSISTDAIQEAQSERPELEGEKKNAIENAVGDSGQKIPFREYTEQEARAQEKTGAYVPARIPQGYVFENAFQNPDTKETNLSVSWTRGMDSIMLFISEVGNPPATVDVGKAETYDLRLYEVPYGESVPEQYRESVDQPVFAREDLSLEIVKSRMISYDDAGDTDTPRGNFSVLYPDGMLVRFSGRGTAVEIWEMFCSMGE